MEYVYRLLLNSSHQVQFNLICLWQIQRIILQITVLLYSSYILEIQVPKLLIL